jgi:hypothetical protein
MNRDRDATVSISSQPPTPFHDRLAAVLSWNASPQDLP